MNAIAKKSGIKIRRKKVKPGHVIFVICMLLLVCFTALPLVAMISRSLMPLDELYVYPPRLFVRKPTLKNFGDLMTSLSSTSVPFTRYVFNSLFTTTVTVLLNVVICSMGAYGLSKFHPKGSKTLFAIITAALMFNTYCTQIPNYMIVVNMGLVNTYWALIIPKVATAYSFFLVKQFSDQLPDSILEAARIDGAGELYTFWKIGMPLLKPAWSTLVVFTFVSNWNDYFSALVYTNKTAMKNLPLAIQTLAGGAGSISRTGATAAATVVTTLPTIIIFCIMRGRVMETMTYSGIKS